MNIDDFILDFESGLARAFAIKYNISVDAVLSCIRPEKEFIPFGKFKTLKKLISAVDKAKAKNKFCNVSTAIMQADNPSVREKYELYDSSVAGIKGSDELKETLIFFPGKLINPTKMCHEPVSSARTRVKRERVIADLTPSMILNKVNGKFVTYDGFVWDENKIMGKMVNGKTIKLSASDIGLLENMGRGYFIDEYEEFDEGSEYGYEIDVIERVKTAIGRIMIKNNV